MRKSVSASCSVRRVTCTWHRLAENPSIDNSVVTPFCAQVGDYILSPEMCVERKSLSDLRQSFQSGRLYNQAEAMSKHYKTPILLIEFDRDRAFALHSSAELGSDISVICLASSINTSE
jgi:DNA excision repair protein ERCC-4